MARRKYQFKSRAEAEGAYREATQEATLNAQAVSSLVQGEVEWIHEGKVHAGICRLEGNAGGLVILRGNGTGIDVFPLDNFVEWTRGFRLLDDEAMALRLLGEKVLAARAVAWKGLQ